MRRQQADEAIRAELRERHLQDTALIRKIFKMIGLGLGGLVVLAGLIFGGIAIYRSLPPYKVVSGTFGQIKLAELNENRFATVDTSKGSFKIELDTANTPNAAANFVLLAQKGFYEGVKFHRVIKDFMIQTGDPNSKDDDPSDDGRGDPGYRFADEAIVGDYARGVVAMANSGKDTNGSQCCGHQDSRTYSARYQIHG